MYIVLEGIKGSGKSTQFARLQQWLQQHHPEVPLLCPTQAMPPECWWEQAAAVHAHDDDFVAALYTARANHHASQIDWQQPLVVGERSILTSWVTRLPEHEADQQQHMQQVWQQEYHSRVPDHVIYLDVGQQFERLQQRLHGRQRSYGLADETQQRLRHAAAGYACLQTSTHPLLSHTQWHVLDAWQDPDVLQQQILTLVQAQLFLQVAATPKPGQTQAACTDQPCPSNANN